MDRLFCLSSGQPASDKVSEDLLRYTEAGKNAAEEFIKTRLVDKSAKFHNPMKKLNLETFQSMAAKATITTAAKKTLQVKAEHNLLGRLLMLSQDNDISLHKMFEHPLGPIPWSLATADGGMVKTDKSQLLHHLESKAVSCTYPRPDKCIYNFISWTAMLCCNPASVYQKHLNCWLSGVQLSAYVTSCTLRDWLLQLWQHKIIRTQQKRTDSRDDQA